MSRQLFDETTLIGCARNRSFRHRDKIYLKSYFDSLGKKTQSVHSITWGDLEQQIQQTALGLDALGIRQFDKIAVMGPNTPRWIIAVYGILALRGTFVPIYPTSRTNDVRWSLHDSNSRIIFCHHKKHLEKIISVKPSLNDLEYVVVMTPGLEMDEPWIISFEQLLTKGQENTARHEEIKARTSEASGDDVAAIFYTSGTTGQPKGVMLSNSNFLAQRKATEFFNFTPDDIWFGHLPLCHSLGFSVDLLNSGFQSGELFLLDSVDTKSIRLGLATCRPTAMTSVPRLWEKLFLQINNLVKKRPALIQALFNNAIKVGKEHFLKKLAGEPISPTLRFKAQLAERIFKKIRKKAGLERLRICITGGGPIHYDLLVFFGAIGIELYQGFGLTETSPVTHTSVPGANRLGYIGRPIPDTQCKLAHDGELLIKGPQVMKGYYNNEKATSEVFTDDGFFMTGDVAIQEDGFYKITDRKKEILITSGGKNIGPQSIQNAFDTDPYTEMVYVVGDAKNYISALLIPNFNFLETWAADEGIVFKDRVELVNNKKIQDLFEQRVDKVNKTLSSFETIKRFAVLSAEFSEEGGELTPSFKLKRSVIEKKYKKLIDSLYPGEA